MPTPWKSKEQRNKKRKRQRVPGKQKKKQLRVSLSIKQITLFSFNFLSILRRKHFGRSKQKRVIFFSSLRPNQIPSKKFSLLIFSPIFFSFLPKIHFTKHTLSVTTSWKKMEEKDNYVKKQ